MLAYDLIGFQTDEDRQNFEDYLLFELGLTADDGTVASEWGLTQLATFPIGIDVDEFAARATRAFARPEVSRLRASLQGAKLVLGVDRLDYSKGLANRCARSTGCWRSSRLETRRVAAAGRGSVAREHSGLP